ncbi:MAG: HNH endonuclease signature motif containing protein [Dehalococcoidia bacterium]
MSPVRPHKACAYPGCGAVVPGGQRYCGKHKGSDRKRQDERRGTAAERGYDRRWRDYRTAYLAVHPLCVECERQGVLRAATVVDHIMPHRGDMGLFWDSANHQALCKRCHDRKTAKGE